MTEQELKKMRKSQLRSLVLEMEQKLASCEDEMDKQKRTYAKDINVLKAYHQQEIYNKDQEYKEEIEYLRNALNDRTIAIEDAGSIAEAALRVQKIFTDAQEAADLYLENLSELVGQQSELTKKRDEESKARAEQILNDAKKQSDELLEVTQVQCRQMREQAESEAQKYWEDVSKRLEDFYQEHRGLREILQMTTGDAEKADTEE